MKADPANHDAAAAACAVADVVEGVVEGVFASVVKLRDLLAARHRAATARGDGLRQVDIEALREPLSRLLAAEPAVVGMGVIVAPGLLPERPLLLEWWQSGAGSADPSRLEVDLNAASIDFYDYGAAEWFAVPRRTGRRHVVGPYVDVHGTDRYLLTLTEPVVCDGAFLGVAGADVPVARFETLVLRALADFPGDVVLTNVEGRVVLSTSARWLVGDLLHGAAGAPAGNRVRLLDLPWELTVPPTESGPDPRADPAAGSAADAGPGPGPVEGA